MMLVDGQLREVPVGALAYDRRAASWVFDHAEAARRLPAELLWVPRDVVELWEDGAGALTIHVEGAEVVFAVTEGRSTFDRDVAALVSGKEDLIRSWWRAGHWNEHADRIAGADGPRLVALWDAGQVQLLRAGQHPYGERPGPAAMRYLGRS